MEIPRSSLVHDQQNPQGLTINQAQRSLCLATVADVTSYKESRLSLPQEEGKFIFGV